MSTEQLPEDIRGKIADQLPEEDWLFIRKQKQTIKELQAYCTTLKEERDHLKYVKDYKGYQQQQTIKELQAENEALKKLLTDIGNADD